jgi:hypothetical protein
MNGPGHPPGDAVQPIGKTVLGETVWPVLAGRAPSQETGLEHLLWGGPGDAIHLYTGGRADGRMEYPGRDSGAISGPCATAYKAQQAAKAYLTDRQKALTDYRTYDAYGRETTPIDVRVRLHRADAARAAAAAQSSVPAGEAPATALGGADQTARILAEHGTPERRLEYALMEAGRRKSAAYAAAWEQCKAAGKSLAAKQRYEVDYEAAHAEWTVEVASVVAGYAGEIGAAAPDPSPGTDDLGRPYHRGWTSGADMLLSDITHRRAGYDDGQWREYVAGYAEGAQAHAEATVAQAQAVRERVRQVPAESASDTASSGKEPARAQGPLSGAPGRDESAGPGLGAAMDFPGAPAARPAARPGRRPAGSGITSAAGRTRPGGLR